MTSVDSSRERPLLKEVAYEHIKQLMCDGSHPPGTFLSERELAAALNMSKTPVRAAFERLSEQGFVTIAPQRGVIVRQLSPKEISDHFDLRIALETFIARKLAGRISAEQEAQVQANLELQRQQVTDPLDLAGWTTSDSRFHLMLAEFVGNDEIVRTMTHQRERVQRVVGSIATRDKHIPPKSQQEHQAIFDLIRAGDGEAAAKAVEEHLLHGMRFLLLGGRYGD